MSKLSEIKEILGEHDIIDIYKSGRSFSAHMKIFGIGASLLSELIDLGLIDIVIYRGTLKFNFYLGGKF